MDSVASEVKRLGKHSSTSAESQIREPGQVKLCFDKSHDMVWLVVIVQPGWFSELLHRHTAVKDIRYQIRFL